MSDRDAAPLRSKGLLPALGVGAAVYVVTGAVSVGTLGLIGVGAGVGYGVGNFIAKKYHEKQAQRQGGQHGPVLAQPGQSSTDLPAHLQASLQAWQNFLSFKAQGGQMAPQEVEQAFLEFRQVEPAHAANVTSLIHSTGGVGTPILKPSGSGAAEV
eukprot:gb/GFBE01042506.1/.p1 GENE.gb/GFBE01042506.1/~~gb/GFBE01042506.1/.p1  ORF type:complete len:156 (+),score=32.71 gb/GFBE01042506.1/:1-468(+)